MTRLRRPSPGVVLLALLAYLPALTAAPGRMASDSKLYLYLDPQRLISDGFHNFDPRQFAGWVPHQHIAYLWPSGPWFSVFEIVGVPDWIAHRLWIGTLLFLAGLGVRWVAGMLGLSPAGALAAAVVYQCSPYLLPYVSRTSVMLLPWAGLGWIVGLTMLATLRSRWRHAALLALVVLTVGAVNATALLMIVPAPLLWLIHAASSGATTWRRAAATAGRVGVLSIVVSLWWAVALVLQGRHGSDVLAFSETLEAVSFTSSSTEVLRGLGYWLFYVRDPFGATTTAAVDHLASGRTIILGLVLVLVCVTGLVVTRWQQRRYAAWLVLVGVVLAVGVHPIGRTSPLMSLATGDGSSGLALALRSSTRAVPVSVFGLALGAGALVTALRARQWRGHHDVDRFAVAAVVVLAVLGLPALWTGGLIDPALERDQDPPAAWSDAVTALDAGPDGYRVLQVPGSEFGSFRWGHTVDQPLPGMSDTPVVTRDLLPLGSPAAMDLLYALDDRFQRGVMEPDSIAPLARLFGARTVWLANDLAYDRYRTPRPDVVADLLAGGADGLDAPRSFGEPEPNVPVVSMFDEQAVLLGGTPAPLPPVQLLDVTEPVPVVRAMALDRTVVLSGDGDGVVDAAAAGVIDGTQLIRYAGSLHADDLDRAIDEARLVVVTDTNRPRARHWRSSQDTVGFTEDGTGRPQVLRPADGDARLEVFPRADLGGPDVEHRTVAVQDGPVTARASAYGEPFAYRPEVRAWRAIDGDVSSAWLVADRFDAVGERLQLELTEPARHLVVRQPGTDPGARRIAAVDIRLDGGEPLRAELDQRSLEGDGQALDVDGLADATRIELAIAATHADPGHPEQFGAVGFAEVDLGLGPTREVVRLPEATVGTVGTVGADTALTVVLTRDRVRPTDRWRGDPEPSMVRELTLGAAREFTLDLDIRLDQRAPDAMLGELLGVTGVEASDRLTGSAVSWVVSAFDGRADTAWVSSFGSAVGESLRFEVDPSVPAGTITIRQPRHDTLSVITAVRLSDETGTPHDVDLRELIDASGTATFDVEGLTGAARTIEITAIEPRIVFDRRYGEPVVLPVSIGAIEGVGVPVVDLPGEVDTGCRSDLLSIDGQGISLRISGSTTELLAGASASVEPCDGAVLMDAGRSEIETLPGSVTGLQIDRVVLAATSSAGDEVTARDEPRVTMESSGRTRREITVDGCEQGCWVVLGEGYNPAWTGTVDGVDMGPPVLVDGGFNGWRLGPGSGSRSVTFTWSPQPVLTAGITLSALGILGCLILVAVDRRRRPVPHGDVPDLVQLRSMLAPAVERRDLIVVAASWSATAALVIAPLWVLAPLPAIAVMAALRSMRPAGVAAVALAATGAAVIVWRVITIRPAPDAAWVLRFEDLHRPGMFVVTALFASAFLLDRRSGSSLTPTPADAADDPTAPPA